jgi:hypothetical protein
MHKMRVAKSRIVEAACRNDLLSCFRSCFHILEPGATLNMNWHHEAIAYHLELVLHGVIKRLIIAYCGAAPDTQITDGLGGVAGLRAWS